MEKETTKKEKKPKVKKPKQKIKGFTIAVILADLLAVVLLVVIYGPWSGFRNFWVTTAMTTMRHQYLAYMLYSPETINDIMSQNYIKTIDEEVNLDDIVIGNTGEQDSYSSIYEQQILEREEGNDIYKIIRINEDGYKGYLTVIYDPKNVDLAVPTKLGVVGQSVATMCRLNNGLVGINGGGFQDLDGWGNGSTPYGAIIKDGKLVWDYYGGNGGLIGFTNEHKLWLTYDEPDVAIEKGMRDAVEFGPFLIVNGKASEVHGDGGWGIAPRTVIAQRKDGIVLFLVIEGRLPGYSTGASMSDVIKLLSRYKAYNAANLDGGASTTMAVNGRLYNKPSAGAEYGGRAVSNAWIVVDRSKDE